VTVVDTSALIAILNDEPDAARYARALADADVALLSSVSMVEAGIVMLRRKGPGGNRKLLELIQHAGIRVEDVSLDHAHLAMEAYSRYCKGLEGSGRLNFGDCFSYALAKAADLPLLFKGEEFAQTDLKFAL